MVKSQKNLRTATPKRLNDENAVDEDDEIIF